MKSLEALKNINYKGVIVRFADIAQTFTATFLPAGVNLVICYSRESARIIRLDTQLLLCLQSHRLSLRLYYFLDLVMSDERSR